MEAKVNTSRHARTFVQVISPAPGLLGCMYKVLGYLSGMLSKVSAHVVSLISSLFGFRIYIIKPLHDVLILKHTEVSERYAAKGHYERQAHDRRHALFTGSTK